MAKRILAVYLRVSSSSQSTASQEPDLERWIAANLDVLRGDVEVRWYRDTYTGTSMDRPGWKRLEADYKAGKVQAVVVWRLDRLGRTTPALAALFEDLLARKVGLISLREGIDLSTPAGRLMAHVLASVAQYETEVRQERSLAGIEVARSQGKHLGRPSVGRGNGTRLKVTAEQAIVIRRLHQEGQGVTAISRAVGLSRPTIYSVLESD